MLNLYELNFEPLSQRIELAKLKMQIDLDFLCLYNPYRYICDRKERIPKSLGDFHLVRCYWN